jgi:hypothetical protein
MLKYLNIANKICWLGFAAVGKYRMIRVEFKFLATAVSKIIRA